MNPSKGQEETGVRLDNEREGRGASGDAPGGAEEEEEEEEEVRSLHTGRD